jgi:hypothetical protein
LFPNTPLFVQEAIDTLDVFNKMSKRSLEKTQLIDIIEYVVGEVEDIDTESFNLLGSVSSGFEPMP